MNRKELLEVIKQTEISLKYIKSHLKEWTDEQLDKQLQSLGNGIKFIMTPIDSVSFERHKKNAIHSFKAFRDSL